MIKIIFLLCSSFIYGQLLHRQSINSQGNSFKLTSGLLVSQTIGQQSNIGTATNPVIVQQGFQQSFWSTLIQRSTPSNSLQFVFYPNPVKTIVTFQFSSSVDEQMTISIFDIQGRIVLNKEEKVTNGLISIDLSTLANSSYLIRLTSNSTTNFCKIIKTL